MFKILKISITIPNKRKHQYIIERKFKGKLDIKKPQ